jgi:hypothetical protein
MSRFAKNQGSLFGYLYGAKLTNSADLSIRLACKGDFGTGSAGASPGVGSWMRQIKISKACVILVSESRTRLVPTMLPYLSSALLMVAERVGRASRPSSQFPIDGRDAGPTMFPRRISLDRLRRVLPKEKPLPFPLSSYW